MPDVLLWNVEVRQRRIGGLGLGARVHIQHLVDKAVALRVESDPRARSICNTRLPVVRRELTAVGGDVLVPIVLKAEHPADRAGIIGELACPSGRVRIIGERVGNALRFCYGLAAAGFGPGNQIRIQHRSRHTGSRRRNRRTEGGRDTS